MNASHSPLNQLPVTNPVQIPQKINPYPMICPERASIRVALEKLLVTYQRTALKIRPPSNGKPGTWLKSASIRLIDESQPAKAERCSN